LSSEPQIVLGALAVAITYAPSVFATWTATCPTPPAAAWDEHALLGLHLRDLGQRLPRGEPDERQRRGHTDAS